MPVFSAHLFWDVAADDVDVRRHQKFLVARVLEYGTLTDWQTLLTCYSLDEIVATAQALPCLDIKAVAFLSCLADVPRNSFRCCATMIGVP